MTNTNAKRVTFSKMEGERGDTKTADIFLDGVRIGFIEQKIEVDFKHATSRQKISHVVGYYSCLFRPEHRDLPDFDTKSLAAIKALIVDAVTK